MVSVGFLASGFWSSLFCHLFELFFKKLPTVLCEVGCLLSPFLSCAPIVHAQYEGSVLEVRLESSTEVTQALSDLMRSPCTHLKL